MFIRVSQMFISVSHKMKNVVSKHWKLSLCLLGVVFLALLTVFTYSMPDVAKIVLMTTIFCDFFFALTGGASTLCAFDGEGRYWLFLTIIGFILAIVLAGELAIFKG